jgi:signal transduction histidine kinase
MASLISDVTQPTSFALARFDRSTSCHSTCFLLASDAPASDRPSADDSLTPMTDDAVLRSVQRIDDFMTDGRSGSLDQTLVNHAKRDAHAAHEAHLQQIGADLHDGPAQLLALALLRIDALGSQKTNAAITTAAAPIRDVVADALREVRDISVGLVLPELDRRSAAATVRLAIDTYQRRTGCDVKLDDAGLPVDYNPVKAIKICLYRLIQEGLQNGFKHARGAEQSVTIQFIPPTDGGDATLVATVRDSRPAPCITATSFNEHSTCRQTAPRTDGTSSGIGLAGLRERIAALNGTFVIHTSTGGTELMARLAVRP